MKPSFEPSQKLSNKPLVVAVWSLALVHCGQDSTFSEGTPGSGNEQPVEAAAGEPTFWQHVAPILETKCVACHQDGGIAPFALDNFSDAERRATLIADMTENRIMPPYLLETGGACGDFDESAALTEEQIATIGAWARGDRAEGVPDQMVAPLLPVLAEGTDFFTPDFTPEIEGGPLAQFDEYRCFAIDMGLSEEAYVTAFDFAPGNTQIVHHSIAMLVDPAAPSAIEGLDNAQAIQRLRDTDSKPGREGWHCFGDAGEGVSIESSPAGWAPGSGVYRYPAGAGVRVKPGRILVVQMHYNLVHPETRGQSDRSRMRLELKSSVDRQAMLLLTDAFLATLRREQPDVLLPGNPAAQYTWTRTGAELGIPENVPVQLLTLTPHMHERGRKYTFEVGRDGNFDCQGRINRWDFNWQRSYVYDEAPTLDSNSQLRVTCEYDTSSDTNPVLPGWGTQNEMCELTIGVAFPPGVTF